jgi:hypothetical protein
MEMVELTSTIERGKGKRRWMVRGRERDKVGEKHMDTRLSIIA